MSLPTTAESLSITRRRSGDSEEPQRSWDAYSDGLNFYAAVKGRPKPNGSIFDKSPNDWFLQAIGSTGSSTTPETLAAGRDTTGCDCPDGVEVISAAAEHFVGATSLSTSDRAADPVPNLGKVHNRGCFESPHLVERVPTAAQALLRERPTPTAEVNRPDAELRRLADQGTVLLLTKGFYALIPEDRRGTDTHWQPTIEAAALGIAAAIFDTSQVALVGPSAARAHRCYPRALGNAFVSVPNQRRRR